MAGVARAAKGLPRIWSSCALTPEACDSDMAPDCGKRLESHAQGRIRSHLSDQRPVVEGLDGHSGQGSQRRGHSGTVG